MKRNVEFSHDPMFLGAWLFLVVVLIGQISSSFRTISVSVSPRSQLSQVSSSLDGVGSGLVGWWKFDEGSGALAADASGNGNTGTLINSPSWTSGKLGQALLFNGTNSSVSVATSPTLSNFSKKSVFMWVNPSGTSGDIFTNGYWTAPYGDLFQMSAGNSGFIYVKNTSGTRVGTSITNGFIANQWNFVGYTWDGQYVTYYLNGSKFGSSAALSGTLGSIGEALSIGSRASRSSGFGGMIDDVRIYDRALSSAEVASLYAGLGSSSNTTASSSTSGSPTVTVPPAATTTYSGTSPHTWYVDNEATGINDGTSWANAWNSFAGIVWCHTWQSGCVGVKGGDTLFISGGTNSKTYRETLNIPYSIGAASDKRLIVYAGQDQGHSGIVTIDGENIRKSGIVMNDGAYITVSGNHNGQIHLILKNFTDPASIQFGTAISGNTTSGSVVEYVEVADSNNGINIQGDGNEIRNCYMHGIMGNDAINVNGFKNYYDSNLVHDCRIQLNQNFAQLQGSGPDGIEGSSGVSVYNNEIYSAPGKVNGTLVNGTIFYQHQDAIQPLGSYWKIYNNVILNMGNSAVESGSVSTMPTSGPYAHEYGHFKFYNNVVAITDPSMSGWPRGVEWLAKPGATRVTDFLIANNTFVDIFKWSAIRFDSVAMGGYSAPTPSVDGISIFDNIIFNSGVNASAAAIMLPTTFSQNLSNVSIDYNLINAGSHGDGHIYVNGSEITQTHGVGGVPAFASYSLRSLGNSFHLLSTDIAAKDKGTDLSNYFSNDLDNVKRPQGSAWDIGAYEYVVGGVTSPITPTVTIEPITSVAPSIPIAGNNSPVSASTTSPTSVQPVSANNGVNTTKSNDTQTKKVSTSTAGVKKVLAPSSLSRTTVNQSNIQSNTESVVQSQSDISDQVSSSSQEISLPQEKLTWWQWLLGVIVDIYRRVVGGIMKQFGY